ncbi:dehydrogenase [Rhodoblastus sphagnicola]|uniref:Dehydrogenase n=1 Tax=Rhodoblastus sphagnicola TaxID=333368 RepID=A0A2S6NG75_9HYPH|nr:SDR family oxidoreductase [Rhodoblastus sphagnicola]MBB4200833.1 NAD(P)-dependent dehydrogenase (short-subunit alcohol dehydrogenase family) [Rhodoblastus sphagnicola]PPQ33611.1 dehydrogenase [Rhodoblastus sphagnicola]
MRTEQPWGIGAGIAERFADIGASVVLTDVNKSKGQEVAARIRAKGGKAVFQAHDVANESHWEAAVAAAIGSYGQLDVLVNNAAIEQTVWLADVDFADMQKLLTINVSGAILGHKHAIRVMRPGGASGRGGSIINISSVAALIGAPGLGVYSASKGAIRLLSKAAAVERGALKYGIRVNALHPAFVQTEMGEKLPGDFVSLGVFPDIDAARKAHTALYPQGRTGVPRDIADAAVFLASDMSSWVTGTELVVDGGLSIC